MNPDRKLRDATGKLRLKQRASRWKKARWYVIGFCALAVAGLAVWLLWFSQVFVVRTVEVSAGELLSADQLTEAAQVPMGTQLVRLDTGPIADRIAALPAVDKVTVSASWPSTVKIVVAERVPVFQRQDGSTYSWVDAAGVAFNQASAPKPGLVVMTGASDPRVLRDVATVLSKLSPQLKERTITIAASSPDRIVLGMAKDVNLVWGSADSSDLKSQVATALLQVPAKLYDVSAPENPITRR